MCVFLCPVWLGALIRQIPSKHGKSVAEGSLQIYKLSSIIKQEEQSEREWEKVTSSARKGHAKITL